MSRSRGKGWYPAARRPRHGPGRHPQRRWEVAGHEQDTGRGRVSGQGQDDREVPGGERRPGFSISGTSPRATWASTSTTGSRSPTRSRGLEEARRRPEEGPEGERGPDPRDGLRPGGRGDRVPRGVPAGGRSGHAKRATFTEITRDAILEAFRRPREIDLKLFDAQEARRVLDRLVGYKISPLPGGGSSPGSRPGACSRSRCG